MRLTDDAYGWVHPRNLPRTPCQGVTTLIHVLLCVPSLRFHLLKPQVSRLLILLSTVVKELFVGYKAKPLLFKELCVCLNQLLPPNEIKDLVVVLNYVLRAVYGRNVEFYKSIDTLDLETLQVNQSVVDFQWVFVSKVVLGCLCPKDMLIKGFSLCCVAWKDFNLWTCVVRGRNVLGDVCWFECKETSVKELAFTDSFCGSFVCGIHLFFTRLVAKDEGVPTLFRQCEDVNFVESEVETVSSDSELDVESQHVGMERVECGEIDDFTQSLYLTAIETEDVDLDDDVEHLLPDASSFETTLPPTVLYEPVVPEYVHERRETCSLHVLLNTMLPGRRSSFPASH